MRYPIHEGANHTLIRDRARYLRWFFDMPPTNALYMALNEWRENNLRGEFVKKKGGPPFKVHSIRHL